MGTVHGLPNSMMLTLKSDACDRTLRAKGTHNGPCGMVRPSEAIFLYFLLFSKGRNYFIKKKSLKLVVEEGISGLFGVLQGTEV